jgi:hypothetical protein
LDEGYCAACGSIFSKTAVGIFTPAAWAVSCCPACTTLEEFATYNTMVLASLEAPATAEGRYAKLRALANKWAAAGGKVGEIFPPPGSTVLPGVVRALVLDRLQDGV